MEQRPHERLLLDGGGHLGHGSEAGRGWNDLNPGLPLSKPTWQGGAKEACRGHCRGGLPGAELCKDMGGGEIRRMGYRR